MKHILTFDRQTSSDFVFSTQQGESLYFCKSGVKKVFPNAPTKIHIYEKNQKKKGQKKIRLVGGQIEIDNRYLSLYFATEISARKFLRPSKKYYIRAEF